MATKKASQILCQAAEEMEKRGKSRGSFKNSKGNVCALGAIRIVAFGDPFDWTISPSYLSALKTLEEVIPDNYSDDPITSWNDKNNKDTVVAGLQKAAELAKARGN